ncbi:MAG: WG repeat-containing protein [Prevotella sp.]|nr:WG repeat-containing protein [Prevotella sp.]
MSQINLSQMLPIGVILGGRYRIERYLASGGFGNTYEVMHTHLGQKMALKEFFMTGVNHRGVDHVSVMVSNEANTSDYTLQMDKFRREAQRLSQLHHPNIVHVTDLFDANGTSYYVMDLIQGDALSARLKRGPLTENEARNVLTQLLNALETVHNAGLTHLDIKPDNIMVDRTWHATLIDFGASKQLFQNQRSSMSMSGMAYTPGYAPYEQVAQMTDKLGPWTDFYAVGATMYHLLTGNRPPEVEPTAFTESALVFPPQVSTPMRQFVFRMMNPDRHSRPQTVSEARAHLTSDTVVRPNNTTRPYLQNGSTQPYPTNRPNRPNSPNKPNPPKKSPFAKAFLYIVPIAIILIVAGIILLNNLKEKPGDNPEPPTPPENQDPKKELDESITYSESPFDNCGTFHDGLAPALIKGKWGYVNKDGQWVVKPKYDKAYDFSEGMAWVIQNNRSGYIDKEGNEVVPLIYESGGFFVDGLAAVRLNGKVGFVNLDGKLVIACKYERAWNFKEGMAAVMADGKWGYIDKEGEEVVPRIFDDADDFHDGYARVKRDSEYLLIDQSGNNVLSETGAYLGEYSEGLVCIGINNQYGFINIDGGVVVQPIYDFCGAFKEGLAAYQMNNEWGFIDKTGDVIIPARYQDVENFEDGLARVKRNGKWGYIDKNGEEVIPVEYDDIGAFSEGLAYYRLDGKYGYLDKQGNKRKIKINK